MPKDVPAGLSYGGSDSGIDPSSVENGGQHLAVPKVRIASFVDKRITATVGSYDSAYADAAIGSTVRRFAQKEFGNLIHGRSASTASEPITRAKRTFMIAARPKPTFLFCPSLAQAHICPSYFLDKDSEKPLYFNLFDGGRCRSRTYDPLIKSQLLYQLS